MTGTFNPAGGSQAQMTLSSQKKKSMMQMTRKKLYSSDKKLIGTLSLMHEKSNEHLYDSVDD